MSLFATPFHARAAAANRHNAWQTRGGFTLASCYTSSEEEAIAARFGVVMADISWHWRIEIAGIHARDLVARLFTRNAASLAVGTALEALWLNDSGAVRGAGTVVRSGEDSFLLVSSLADVDWIAGAARVYGVEVRDATASEGGLALIGPAAGRLLAAAGIDAAAEPMSFAKAAWRGLDLTLSRFGLGYELWCEPDAALIVWDRLAAAGGGCALCPAGQEALDILEVESGVMRAGRDYTPARDGFCGRPSPQALGLSGLVDRSHVFNGRAGVLAAGADASLAGVLIDGETPLADTVLTLEGRQVGRTLSSRYSPALKGAVAFAVLTDPRPAGAMMAGATPCRPVALPFLAIPAPMDATETGSQGVQRSRTAGDWSWMPR